MCERIRAAHALFVERRQRPTRPRHSAPRRPPGSRCPPRFRRSAPSPAGISCLQVPPQHVRQRFRSACRNRPSPRGPAPVRQFSQPAGCTFRPMSYSGTNRCPMPSNSRSSAVSKSADRLVDSTIPARQRSALVAHPAILLAARHVGLHQVGATPLQMPLQRHPPRRLAPAAQTMMPLSLAFAHRAAGTPPRAETDSRNAPRHDSAPRDPPAADRDPGRPFHPARCD